MPRKSFSGVFITAGRIADVTPTMFIWVLALQSVVSWRIEMHYWYTRRNTFVSASATHCLWCLAQSGLPL